MDTSALRQFILDSFNLDEVRDLCFSLRINYDDLSGDNRLDKTRELIAWCERRNRLADLEATAQRLAAEYKNGQRPRPTSATSTTTVNDGVNVGGDHAHIGGSIVGRDQIIQHITQTNTPTLRATPPAPPAHFTGREADLAKFTRLLTSGQSVAITALHGLGGIGKTSLAQMVAQQIAAQFPGGVLWWTLGPNPDVITALDVWARHAEANTNLSDYPTAEARAEIVRPLLAKLGKMCVIIDDVWDAASFNVLKSAIPAGNPVLMTTRDADLAKTLRCRVERIDALSDDEAVDLLTNLLGPLESDQHPERSRAAAESKGAHPSTSARAHAERNEVESKHARPSAQDALSAACDIAHLTGGLPLALELIAGLADSPADLPALAQRLKDKSPLDVLKRGTTREQSIEICFSLSYEHLDADLQGRFAALGVFALAPFDRDAMAAVWTEDGDAVDQSISQLVRRSLLSRVILSAAGAKNLDAADETLRRSAPTARAQGDTVEYTQHALLHDYALKLLNRPSPQPSPLKGEGGRAAPGEGDNPFARHADYYRAFAEEQPWRAVEHAFDQVEHGWQWVQQYAPEKIIDYEFAVDNFLRTRGREFERIRWMQIALQATRDLHDRKQEGTFLNNLGYAHNALGQKDKALDYYEQALIIRREVGDRAGEGTTLNNIGSVYWSTGRNEEALQKYEKVLLILREVGDRSGEATTLNNIGTVYDNLGQKDKALDYYEQALVIHREVGNRTMEGTTLNNLGLVYDDLGQKDKALDYYEQALVIRREVGDRAGEGTTLNNLGGVYDDLGQMDKALTYFEQALVIHREVGNRTMEGTTLNNLGAVYRALGQKDKALEYYEQALGIRREVGDRAGEGATLNNLGLVYDALGQKDKALDYYAQALGILREVGDRFGESVTLFNIGMLLDATGRTAEAVTYLEQNVALDEAIGHPDLESDRRTLARARAKLARDADTLTR